MVNKSHSFIASIAASIVIFAFSQSALHNGAIASSAQSSINSMERANEFFQKQDWSNAVAAYQAVVEREPNNGMAWFRLGSSLHSMGKYGEAVKAYHRSVEIGRNPTAMYNLACGYAKTGDKERALEWLTQSVQAGFNRPQQIRGDEDLTVLQGEARFLEAVAVAERNANPCAQTAYRQFDFWIGEWNVFSGGRQAGTNNVQRILDGCVLFENWTSAQGGSGKSFNFYNSQKGKWQQTWVDDKGSVIEFEGEAKDGGMYYKAETIAAGGKKILHRMTFTKLSENRVRQLWEQSADGGNTWSAAFDGDYQRK